MLWKISEPETSLFTQFLTLQYNSLLKNIKINCPHNTVQIDVLRIKPTVLYDTNSVIRKHFSTKFTEHKPSQAKLGELCPPPVHPYILYTSFLYLTDSVVHPSSIYIIYPSYLTDCRDNSSSFIHIEILVIEGASGILDFLLYSHCTQWPDQKFYLGGS